MGNLSVAAAIVLDYAKVHATEDGYVDLQNYSGLPEDHVISACKELRKHGLISDVEYSESSVEYFFLNSR